ncbi:MAG: AEC family transporter [Lachnospiraceae bacterium]|nr:AEC family transporter [Lachnospiraceae bacterium]
MIDAFIFAANAILPIILMIVLGYLLKRSGMLTRGFLDVGNRLTFRVLIPALLYYNVYGIGSLKEINFTFVLYGVVAIFVIFFLSVAVTCAFTRDNAKRGVLIQAMFRSNYAIIGLPLASSLFGDKGAAAAGVMSAFCVPLFNVLSVIVLTVFHGEKAQGETIADGTANTGRTARGKDKIDFKKILIGIIKNPLIVATLLGLATLVVRELFVRLGIGFRLSNIQFLYKSLENVKSICTPFALIVLGGRFEFSAVSRLWKEIVFGTLIRTVAVPVLGLSVAYLIRDVVVPGFGGEHFATFIGVFATPVAVASAIMAKEMDADDELAGQLVVWTSLISTVTIFIYVTILRAIGIF